MMKFFVSKGLIALPSCYKLGFYFVKFVVWFGKVWYIPSVICHKFENTSLFLCFGTDFIIHLFLIPASRPCQEGSVKRVDDPLQ